MKYFFCTLITMNLKKGKDLEMIYQIMLSYFYIIGIY